MRREQPVFQLGSDQVDPRPAAVRIEAVGRQQLEAVALHRIRVFGGDRALLVQVSVFGLGLRGARA
jgi:hypothetical protein